RPRTTPRPVFGPTSPATSETCASSRSSTSGTSAGNRFGSPRGSVAAAVDRRVDESFDAAEAQVAEAERFRFLARAVGVFRVSERALVEQQRERGRAPCNALFEIRPTQPRNALVRETGSEG